MHLIGTFIKRYNYRNIFRRCPLLLKYLEGLPEVIPVNPNEELVDMK